MTRLTLLLTVLFPVWLTLATQAETIRVASISILPKKWDKDANTKKIERLVREAAGKGAKLVITPEGVLEGYVIEEFIRESDPEKKKELDRRFRKLAVPIGSKYIVHFKELTDQLDIHLILGFLEIEGDKLYNTAALLGPEGELVGKYRKTHFAQGYDVNPSGYSPGNMYPVFDIGSLKVGMMICFDRTLPEPARLLTLGGADLIACPSYGGWNELNRWRMRVRANENDVYVVFTHPQQSLIIDRSGEPLVEQSKVDSISISDIPFDKPTGVSARLTHRRPKTFDALVGTGKSIGKIVRLDPALDRLLPSGAKIEVLADGFDWSEGPVWVKEGKYLLFSDVARNHILKWKDGEGLTVFMERSGYTGNNPKPGHQPGSNGLTLDAQGRLVLCCHGDRCVARIEPDGKRTILVNKYEGKKLRSPNDLIYHSNGDLYFTDQPSGLADRSKLDIKGVYRLATDGTLTLLTTEMTRPNGIAFSPDEKTLYVCQSDGGAPIWKAFPVNKDGTLGKSRLFFDATKFMGKLVGVPPDGMKVDIHGNVWATGPGGVLVINPEGKLLGRIETGTATGNCTFAEDGSTLYVTADMYLVRIRTTSKGLGF